MGSSKKHKKHKSERRSKYEDRPPSLKLILKVSGTPEYGSADSPYNIKTEQPEGTPTEREYSEKHKKSKKKKKKKEKDREKRHKHHKDKHRHKSHSSQEDLTLEDDEESSQLAAENAMYYSTMSTSSNISIDSTTREPRTCVLKLKQSRSPLAKLMDHLLKSLEKRDPHQFFAWPVTDDIAPGYSSIITKAMDFSTIRQKIEDNEYSILTEFIDDFKLICNNSIKYNHIETVYNKSAKRLLHAGMRILQPENLLRGSANPAAIFMRDLTIKELGFDPLARTSDNLDSEVYNIDSAEEGTMTSQVDEHYLAQLEEENRKNKIKMENDPKTRFEPFVDTLTSDEILEQVKNAAKNAREKLFSKKRANKMGFLRARGDGTTSMKILVPSEDCVPERMPTLGAFTGKLQQGTGQLQGFREDRRNSVKPLKSLDYGAFSSFAPVFDSRFSNLSKDETELILNTYGDESGSHYAESITNFSKDSVYGSTLANRLLDLLTCGDHSKTMEVLMESEQQKQVQKEVETLLPDYQKEIKRLGKVHIDFDQLKTLSMDIGVDTRFVDVFASQMKNDVQDQLNVNTTLIEQLHQVQHERLSAPLPQHLSLIQQPSKKEIQLADQITTNLTDIAKKLPPSAISSIPGIRKAIGVTSLLIDINSQVASFRDMLIHIGQKHDCPELRAKIRKTRRACVESCQSVSKIILPQIRSTPADGSISTAPYDNPHLILLFYLSQLFLRELVRSYHLLQVIPMDMSGYFENRAGPSSMGMGNVISQILMCKELKPGLDFQNQELGSISKDSQEIAKLLSEVQEFLPHQEKNLETSNLLNEDKGPWPPKRRKGMLYKNMGLLCCISRPPNYI
ncbi:unnamed protein product [Diamesa tonsa]